MSISEFFQFKDNTKYPALQEDTDENLKYLVHIMLKIDPDRRANIEDILSLDFILKNQ